MLHFEPRRDAVSSEMRSIFEPEQFGVERSTIYSPLPPPSGLHPVHFSPRPGQIANWFLFFVQKLCAFTRAPCLLPGSFLYARDLTLVSQLTEAYTADAVFFQD